ncbi:hypothetical protein N7520_011468 [Penicillium odoratum]|uniref:uncharacterized protein n=1 Tax=Penicillium odoratum TaxID=1167516 RepID=UPI00254802F8|nr:uncharacterized protein N7520_011468 [Penicillium odoratum]KAJ5746286.1 hypothetical protein N7520_011468 [Penicillium odoratum]
MTSRFPIRRLRRRKKKVSNNPETEETDTFKVQSLIAQIINLEKTLQQAIQTVDSLRDQLAEYDVFLAHSQCRAAISPSPPPAFQVGTQSAEQISTNISPRMKYPRVWIDDIWLCNAPENSPLQEAEPYWKNGNPQCALEIVSQAIDSNPFLSPAEEIRCRIFAAAVFHSTGNVEESNRRLGIVLQTVARSTRLGEQRAGELSSIAHYILGRNLIELGEFTDAYYSLSRALGTRGYHSKARDYQKNAVIEFTRQMAMGDNASISASLRPIVSRTESSSDEE